jgi:hypothetical protein
VNTKDSLRDSEDAMKKMEQTGEVAGGDDLIDKAISSCQSQITGE